MERVYVVKVQMLFGPDDTITHDYDGVEYHSRRLAIETAADALHEPDVLDAWVEDLEVKR